MKITASRLGTLLAIGENMNIDFKKASGVIRRGGPDKGGHWEVIG